MAKRDVRERLEQCARHPKTCEVPGCYALVQKWGRYCKRHDRTNQLTGHPEGNTIRKGDLQPYVKQAAEFIREQCQHKGVVAALGWTSRLLEQAQDSGELHRSSLPSQRIGKWLNKMHQAEITGEEVLATVVGLYLLRELNPRQFRSDRHFRHMLAIRVLRLVPAPFYEAWCGGTGRRLYHRINVGMREHLAERLVAALGLLSLRMAREIEKRMVEEQKKLWQDKLDGVADPFMKPDPAATFMVEPEELQEEGVEH